MPKAERAGIPTYWTTFGQGPRPALMIHCSLAHSGSWGRLAGHLSGALTMTAFDTPGHGRSARWEGHGEVQAVTTQIAASFLGAPTDIIGHSFGATVALRLAVERPELARSLVLIEPVFFAAALRDFPVTGALHTAETAEFVAATEAGDNRAAARAFTSLWGDGTPWQEIPEDQKQALADQMYLIEAGHSALYDDVGGMLKSGALDRVDMPVLLIEGSDSPAIISAVNTSLAARLPQAARAVIMGAGHMAPITHASSVAAEILRFLQRT